MMRSIIHYSVVLILSLFIISTFLSTSRAYDRKIDYDLWTLDWIEEFNDSVLDSSVWMVMPRRQDKGCRNYISSHDSCYELRDGILTIRAIKNNDVDTKDTARYLTGGIQTRLKKAFPSGGLLEIKARFNGVQGKTCGIWLLPFQNERGWPTDGEIDIMEHGSSISYITQTVHTSYTKSNPKSYPQRYIKQEVNYKDFNVYGVEIEEDSLMFYINGFNTMVYPKVDTLSRNGQYPFYRDWFLLLSTASRGPFDSICAPLEMEIDWVRYYRHK